MLQDNSQNLDKFKTWQGCLDHPGIGMIRKILIILLVTTLKLQISSHQTLCAPNVSWKKGPLTLKLQWPLIQNLNIPTYCWRPAVLHAQIYSRSFQLHSYCFPCSKYVEMKQVFPICDILVITNITTPAYRIYVRYYYFFIHQSLISQAPIRRIPYNPYADYT